MPLPRRERQGQLDPRTDERRGCDELERDPAFDTFDLRLGKPPIQPEVHATPTIRPCTSVTHAQGGSVSTVSLAETPQRSTRNTRIPRLRGQHLSQVSRVSAVGQMRAGPS